MAYAHQPPFYTFLGLEFPDGADHLVYLPANPDLANSKGHVHGGATLGMADAIASRTIRQARPDAAALSTVSLACSFVAPANGDLRGFGRYVGGGRSIVTAEFSVRDSADHEVLRGLATVRVFTEAHTTGRRDDAVAAER